MVPPEVVVTRAMLAAEDWETRVPRTLEAVDAAQVRHEVRACAEPKTKRTGSEGDPTW